MLRAQGCRSISISIHALLAESDRRAHVAAVARCQFLSTLSLRRATKRKNEPKGAENISIHALLAESDGARSDYHKIVHIISIHALLAESDACIMPGRTVCVTFLSTLSLRRATRRRPPTPAGCGYFYPRSPCGERPTRPRPAAAPRKFLSTLSLRRATDANHCNVWLSNISIHALLAESDRPAKWLDIHRVHISIHALLAESDTRKAP